MKLRYKDLVQSWGAIASLPAFGLALIPHATVCPACWPLIGGIVSMLGLSLVLEGWLATPLTILLLVLATLPFVFRATEAPTPMAFALVAAIAIVAGRFLPQYLIFTYGGIALYVTAHLWQWRNSLQSNLCSSCTDECGPPIACSLDRAQFEERKELLAQITKAATEKKVIRNGYALTFTKARGLIPTLASFIEMEQACCPFLNFRLEVTATGQVQLELTGPAAAREIIQELLSWGIS